MEAVAEVSRLLTPQEVAEILRCQPSTVYTLVRRGQLKAVRVGKLVMVSMDSIAEFVRGGGVKPRRK